MGTYFLQVTIFWFGAWALYQLALRRETFFQLNRFYLLGSLVLGLVLPFLDWPALAGATKATGNPVIWLETISVGGGPAAAAAAPAWHWTQVLFWFYLAGCTAALLRLAHGAWLLWRRIRAGQVVRGDGFTWVYDDQPHLPFSCFGYLFWSRALTLDPEEEAQMIAHELAHPRYGHSWDVLLLELVGLAFWWHPLWYAYRHDLRNVHEYQADAAALRIAPRQSYGRLLLRNHLLPGGTPPARLQPKPGLAHSFYSSPLKSRITMMTRPDSKRPAGLKYLLALPLFTLLIACTEESAKDVADTVAVAAIEPVRTLTDTIVTFDSQTSEESTQIVQSDIYDQADQMPVFGACGEVSAEERSACSTQNLMTHVYGNLKYPAEAKDRGEEGMAVVQFVVLANGRVSDVTLAKSSASPSIDAEALRVVNALPDFQPGRIGNKEVNVQLVLPLKFKLE